MDKDLRVCVFCDITTYAYICPECGDYKGLMEIQAASETYDFLESVKEIM